MLLILALAWVVIYYSMLKLVNQLLAMTLLVHDLLFEFLIVMSSLTCILETYLRWRTVDMAQVRWVVIYHMSYRTEQHLFCLILFWIIFLSRIVVILFNQIRLYIKCRKRIIPEIARWMMS